MEKGDDPEKLLWIKCVLSVPPGPKLRERKRGPERRKQRAKRRNREETRKGVLDHLAMRKFNH